MRGSRAQLAQQRVRLRISKTTLEKAPYRTRGLRQHRDRIVGHQAT